MSIKREFNKGVVEIYPTHKMIGYWAFSEENEDEAILANAVAVIAEKNGLDGNTIQHLFPAILRMLNSNSEWSH